MGADMDDEFPDGNLLPDVLLRSACAPDFPSNFPRKAAGSLIHCALAALLDEDPEGCFLCGGERGETFQSYHAAVEDDPDFITIISMPVALCAAPAYFAAVFLHISISQFS